MKHWELMEDEFLKDNHGKIKNSDIANKLKRSEPSIKARVNVLRLNTRITKRWTKKENDYFLENHGKISNPEIAKALNRTTAQIASRVRWLGITKQNKIQKFTTFENEVLIWMYKRGTTPTIMAKIFKCSTSRINNRLTLLKRRKIILKRNLKQLSND
jgi:predicted transcriptional regulator